MMNRPFSIYLDVVRFAAACLVYLWHSNQRWLIHDILPASGYGHSSVIVFFVLSGFVIAYVADVKERDWISYGASRFARVFSVVLPAIALCLVLDFFGRRMAPEVYNYPFDQFFLRIAGSLLMLNEIWFVSITSFSNVPYWSISLEVWYYVLFGVVVFVPGPKRWLLAAAILLLLGPKLILLAPIWWAGVLLYRWRALQAVPLALAWVLLLGSTAAIAYVHAGGILDDITGYFRGLLGPYLYLQLTFAKFFMADYLLCLLVCCHFIGMRRVAPSLGFLLLRIERPVRWLSGYTFTLYLLHQPLFLFWGALLKGDPASSRTWWIVTGLSAASVVVLGFLTEGQRHRLKAAVERVLAARAPVVRGRAQGA